MTRPIARPLVLVQILALGAVAGCGPGMASGGGFGEFGEDSTDEPGDSLGDPSTTDPDPDPSGTGPVPGTDTGETETTAETETETETETGADDWTDPDPPDMPEDPPDPIVADCSRVWTVLDSQKTHGHLGATPIGPSHDDGFVSINPVLASEDQVNVDSWIRSWLPNGELEWESNLSWGDHRDDPMALLSDELGDLLLAGRINANTFEDAMVAKIDGESGAVVWTALRGESGGYSEIAYNGAALVVAGMIGGGDPRLELMALQPDTGEVLWVSDPNDDLGPVQAARGLVVADGHVDVLVDGGGSVDIRRYEPPATTATLLASVVPDGGIVAELEAGDLELLDADRSVAVFRIDDASFVIIIDRTTGETLAVHEIDVFPTASSVSATEVEVTHAGQVIVVGGTIVVDDSVATFVLRLGPELETLCSGLLGKTEIGLSRGPRLRGMAAGLDGAVYTGSFVDSPTRLSAFARWE